MKLSQPQSLGAKAFFAAPSNLSSGINNRRFKGVLKSNFYGKAISAQSGGAMNFSKGYTKNLFN